MRTQSGPDAGTSGPTHHSNEQAEPYGHATGKASAGDEPYRAFEWFKFRSSKWLSSTRGLSLAEVGALATLRAMIHERGEPLADDFGRLARQVGAPSAKAFERIVAALLDADLLVMETGGLWCREIEAEINHQRGVSGAAKKNRSKVGQKSKENQSQSSTGVRRYKSENEDVDREGAPTVPLSTPDQSVPAQSLSTGADAHESASGHGPARKYEIDQAIDVGRVGLCKIDAFGWIGRTQYVRLRRVPNEEICLVVALDDRGHMKDDTAVFEDDFREKIDFGKDGRPVDCPMPLKHTDRSNAA